MLERPHPLTPLVRGWIVLVAGVYAYFRDSFNGSSGGRGMPGWVIGAIILAIALVAILVGWTTWWFTRFVIDEHEVRVETGWLRRRSRRVAFERIQSVDVDQPLVARLVGLAELRIEAGAGEAATRLRYLSRGRAYDLRDYLLRRAVGERTSVAAVGLQPRPGVLVDASAADQLLLTMEPGRIIGAFLLSSELWWSVGISAVIVAVGWVAGAGAFSLAALLPLAFGFFSMVSRRLNQQFNFQLLRTPSGGLRVTSGLTRLISQTLPMDRIQGVRIRQPLLWRIPGWWQVDIDMVGLSRARNSEDNDRRESTVLPAGTRDELAFILRQVLPGIDLDAVTLHRVPRRVRLIRWVDSHTLRWGASPDVTIADHGVFVRRGAIVPLRKFQSVRITQGLLQRALGVASVHVDTTPGPVHLVARHLPAAEARTYASTLLSWGARARRVQDATVASSAFPAPSWSSSPSPSGAPSASSSSGPWSAPLAGSPSVSLPDSPSAASSAPPSPSAASAAAPSPSAASAASPSPSGARSASPSPSGARSASPSPEAAADGPDHPPDTAPPQPPRS
ncbi:PH domain-containing protein [Raineyella sp.]|uniref:PH domain-containing protein n=1 Tax=Raineyella sp. TaxID=1911550 RepID=UPI002B1F08AA|nr:PH domain-containing protein [Raineyella sp.]MEA5153692.1 PH domain-containing protein [Raineyella sp.]